MQPENPKIHDTELIVEEPVFPEIPPPTAVHAEPLIEEQIKRPTDDELELLICMECGANTVEIQEYYMLQDHLWESIVPEHYRIGALCVECFEWFLGRELVSTDFTEAPVNYIGEKSERLTHRLGSYFLDAGGPFDTLEESRHAAETLARARNWHYGTRFWSMELAA